MADGMILFEPGKPVAFASGDPPLMCVAGSGELYLRTDDAQAFLAELGPGDALFPDFGSGASLVLVATGPVEMAPAGPEAAARWREMLAPGSADDASDIAGFNRALAAAVAERRKARGEAALDRLTRQERAAALAGLAVESAAEAVRTAAAILGGESAALSTGGLDSSLGSVPALARRAGLSSRFVKLGREWRHDEQGVLVLRRLADGAILAACWQGSSYRLAREDGPLHEADFDRDAFVLSANLPARLKGFGGILRLAMQCNYRELGGIALAALLIALLGTLVPFATGYILTSAAPSGDAALLIALGLALLFGAAVTYVLSALRSVTAGRLQGKSSLRFASGIFERVLRLPARFFREFSAGDLNQRMSGFESIRELVLSIALTAGLSALMSLVYLGVLASYDLKLAAISVGLIAIYILIVLVTRALQMPLIRAAAELDGALAEQAYETIGAVGKLRTAAAEDRALQRWALRYDEERELEYRAAWINAWSAAIREGWQTVTLVVLYTTVAWQAQGRLDPGNFIAFLVAFGIFQGSFVSLSTQLVELFAAQPQIERIRPLLDAVPESSTTLREPGTLSGALALHDVVFRYAPGLPPVLTGVTLEIPAGAHVAIVGGSGSGKSTLLRLLLGFETADSGRVMFDGMDLASLDPTAVREQIGVVLQSSSLFAGSIIENIRGPHQASLERCMEAAAEAGLAEDLEGFPMGIHTMVTEGAAVLSGGQRQRILIARALVARPRVLFFDEATSALDNRSQAKVSATLDALAATRVTIAHRLSTVANADMICVLERGKLAEQGTFEDLMARDGAFAALARRQIEEG